METIHPIIPMRALRRELQPAERLRKQPAMSKAHRDLRSGSEGIRAASEEISANQCISEMMKQ